MPRQRPIKPEQPRSEPEIIPPARGRTQAHPPGPEWFAGSERGTSRIAPNEHQGLTGHQFHERKAVGKEPYSARRSDPGLVDGLY